MSQNIASIWVYLAQTPLLWLTMTLVRVRVVATV